MFSFCVVLIFAVAMYNPEGSAVSSAVASSIASDKGVLTAARKSSVAPTVKEHIICGAPVMDSDIPKVLILHVIESRSYLPFSVQGSGTQVDRKCCEGICFHGKERGHGMYQKGDLNFKQTWCTRLD